MISCSVMSFISSQKLLHFCPEFFGYVRKQLHRKAKVKFKVHDVTN